MSQVTQIGPDANEGARKEAGEKDKTGQGISGLISFWNDYIKRMYPTDDISSELIDQKDFMTATTLSENYRLDESNVEGFKNIFGKYLKLRKMPTDKFNKHSVERYFEYLDAIKGLDTLMVEIREIDESNKKRAEHLNSFIKEVHETIKNRHQNNGLKQWIRRYFWKKSDVE